MSTAPPGPASPAGPGNQRVPYAEIRDGFLGEYPKNATESLEYFTRIGMYVFRSWQAVAADHAKGAVIDEKACDHRWDECTDADLEAIGTAASALIKDEISRRRARAFVKQYWETSDNKAVLVWRGLGWLFFKWWEAFVGAVGLVIIGGILIVAMPQLTRDVLSALHQILPADEAEAGQSAASNAIAVQPETTVGAKPPARSTSRRRTSIGGPQLPYEGSVAAEHNAEAVPPPAPMNGQ